MFAAVEWSEWRRGTERPPPGRRWVRQSAESPTGVGAGEDRRISTASPLRRPPSSSALAVRQARSNALEVVAWKARVFRSQNETIIWQTTERLILCLMAWSP